MGPALSFAGELLPTVSSTKQCNSTRNLIRLAQHRVHGAMDGSISTVRQLSASSTWFAIRLINKVAVPPGAHLRARDRDSAVNQR